MASAGLRKELECSICLSVYTDPVTLRCGHNFCRLCIDQFLNTQDECRVYCCPECREQFWQRPVLKRNITLSNVADHFLSTQPHEEEEISGIRCTYCIHSPVPAVKSCLLCEASLCHNHLKVHSKSAEHVLSEPSTSLENRRCSVHKKILEYYCTEDDTYICVSCSLAGEHRGHRVEMLVEASEKKKKKLRNVLRETILKRVKTEERMQSLEERWRKAQEKADGEVERVTTLFINIRRQLDDLEKRVQSEISRQEEKMSLSVTDIIYKLEKKKDALSKKMKDIEELYNVTDPLTVLQEPNTGDFCDSEEEGGDEEIWRDDVDIITGMLHAGFSDIMTYLQTVSPAKPEEMRPQHPGVQSAPSHTQVLPVPIYGGDGVIATAEGVGGQVTAAGQGGIYGEGLADILLDLNTAGHNIYLSDDRKTATYTNKKQNRRLIAQRFQDYPQVMTSRGVSSGRHYWDVEIIGRPVMWRVGMCYPSIARKGKKSYLGDNNKSWVLFTGKVYNHQCLLIHDSVELLLPHRLSCGRVRICLDYEAGQLSFYELGDSIIHIHTFTATFTEPLHAVLCMWGGCIKLSGAANARIYHHSRNRSRNW